MKRLLRYLLPVAGPAALLFGCTPADFVNALVPRDGFTLEPSLRYAAGPRGTLDLYLPVRPLPGKPMVVFLYGGGWEDGEKADYRFVGEAFTSRGYAVVIPDYRLFPEIRYPAFLQDCARATAWAVRYRADAGATGPLYLVGHSAGAYNALMLTLDRRWLGAEGLDPDRQIAATVGLAGPYDFLPLTSPTLQALFGPEPERPATQPIAHARGDAPPVLLAAGTRDTTVDPANGTRLAAAIRARGGEAETVLYPGLTHVTVAGALADPLRFLAPVLDDSTRFLAAHAGPRGAVAVQTSR